MKHAPPHRHHHLAPARLAAAEVSINDDRMQIEGASIWRQITAAVEELHRERRPDEAVN